MCVYVCISVCGASRSWDIVVHAALQSIRFDGDRIVAGFTRDSPSGDISRSGTETLKFQATGLDPSDPSNSVQSLSVHMRAGTLMLIVCVDSVERHERILERCTIELRRKGGLLEARIHKRIP
eukprot:1141500-Pelagomonas_calceolata.AAC.1